MVKTLMHLNYNPILAPQIPESELFRTYAKGIRNRVSDADFADKIQIFRSETRFLRKSYCLKRPLGS